MLNLKIHNIPTAEIDRTIEWLEKIKSDCEFRIHQLKERKANNCRAKQRRLMMKELSREIYYSNSEIFKSGDHKSHIDYIKEHLKCDEQHAEAVYEVLNKLAKRKRQDRRDEKIVMLAKSGIKKPVIAKKYGLTRQQVYNILKAHKEG